MPRQPVSASFARERAELRDLVLAPVATSDALTANLACLYHTILDRDLETYGTAAFKPVAADITADHFALRTLLRDRIAQWHAQGLMSLSAQHAARDALRALRYASDIAGEVHGDFEFGDDATPHRRAFGEYGLNTFVAPPFDTGQNIEFRSGDILLVRGTRHNSAAIARIGDVDSQFSHAALVYFDPAGRGFVVEALIEDGAVITPLRDALDHGIARAMLFRHRDAELAARAAKLMHDHVKWSLSPEGKPILYDFSMRLGGTKRMFCSKLIRIAFEDASYGRLKLPAFTTRFHDTNRAFHDLIGIKAAETFAPGDLEIDPDVDLVAEWQDHRFTSQIRLQDLIMSKLFEWMEVHGYRFEPDWSVRLIALAGRFSTRLSKRAQNLVASLFARIPPHMPRRTIATIVMLHKTAQPLLEDLQHRERLMVLTEGRPLHPREAFAHLDEIRRHSNGQLGYLAAPHGWRRKLAELRQRRPRKS